MAVNFQNTGTVNQLTSVGPLPKLGTEYLAQFIKSQKHHKLLDITCNSYQVGGAQYGCPPCLRLIKKY
jgi:hypothetical protein